MKLHRLDLEGFGPFLERQTVDFDAFADDGIFLIAGRTGAGKSSVLDGVCYALYGGVPRYDSAERRLRSDHCTPDDPTEVSLEFSAAGRRWRVTRSPEYDRPKRRGGGLTSEPHRAQLERLDAGAWVGVAARPVDVAAELDEIVGLSQQQFLQVILLAQNRFARFLLARNDERQALLRTLFGTRTYEEHERRLDDRRKEAARALEASDGTARLLLDEGDRAARDAGVLDAGPSAPERDDPSGAGADPSGAGAPPEAVPAPATAVEVSETGESDLSARLDRLVRATERAAYRVEVAAEEVATTDAAVHAAARRHAEAAAQHDAQVRRRDLRAAVATLDGERPAVDDDRRRLTRSVAAEAVRATLDAADRAVTAARDAEETVAAAAQAWTALGEDASPGDALHPRDDVLTAAIAKASDAREAELALVAVEDERATAVAAADAAERALVDLDAHRAAVPARLRDLDERCAALAAAPAARDAARTRLDELVARRDAAREAESLASPREQADRAAIAAATALVEATREHTALLQRRLASAAGDLARQLVEGEDCPVCGATEHPRPAHPGDEPVTDAAIERAAAAKDEALDRDREAGRAATRAREAYAVAAARAGGQDPASLEAAVAEARAAWDAARDDVELAERLTAERAALRAVDAEAADTRETLVAEVAARRQAVALAEQRAQTLGLVVAAGRAEFSSAAERLADLEGRRARLRALVAAETAVGQRSQARADALADRDARLAASGLGDAESARAALLGDAERTLLDERIREHESARRAHRQALLDLELELADAPDEPVDPAPAAAEEAAARARHTAAVAAHATAAAAAARLRGLAERSDAAHRGIAALAERHAVIDRLARTVAGRAPNTHRMTLETFVLAAELEEIVRAANVRLADMSAGRYRLQHSDALAARGAASGLGLAVSDAFTGHARPPQSLSGGETFLASLALALGLAEVVTARAGGIRLDTLFIDEGFGSLDAETLDLALRTLDELRQGGRTVGVISHVAAMKEQIPAQLAIRATANGPSVIRHGQLATP